MRGMSVSWWCTFAVRVSYAGIGMGNQAAEAMCTGVSHPGRCCDTLRTGTGA